MLSISEVADITGISAFTIRYYDKCGFFPNLMRNKHGVRSFADGDVTQLLLVDALRKSGLSIEGIQYFVKLVIKGKVTAQERLAILRAQRTTLEYQRDELEESMKRLDGAIACLTQPEDFGATLSNKAEAASKSTHFDD